MLICWFGLQFNPVDLSGMNRDVQPMSVYQLQKMLRDVNRIPAAREAYFQSRDEFLQRYELTDDERQAVVELDIGALYRKGVHGLILRPFTLLHKVAEPDYLKAIRGG